MQLISGRKKKTNEQIVEEILLEEYEQYYRLAYSYVKNEADAGDIVQNGAYKALRSSHTLRQPEFAKTWVYRIMLNEIYAHLRQPKNDSYEFLQESKGYEAESVEDKYVNIDLQRALDSLPKQDKAIITMKYFEDKKLDEIADILNDTFERNHIDRSRIAGILYNQMIINFRGFSKTKIQQVLSKSIGIHYLGKGAVDCKSILNEIRIEKKSLLDGCRGLKWEKVEDTGIAGLSSITEWLEARKELFDDPENAIRQHIDVPRGIIVAGIPGSGKSLMAKSAAHILGLPLVSLDMGDLLGGLVGDSEHNMIEALRIAERMSPCVLWIDEIEKAFSGSSQNSSQSDGGVGRRMFGKFLTWMQEKSSSCFVFATSNDVTSLPPELFRSERFDRKFFTFMPNAEECSKIFASNIQKQNAGYKNEISHLNFTQTLDTPEYLFSPELENSSFWLQFINDSCSSMMPFVSLEERRGKDGLSWYGWKDGKRPKLKLMTGADISALVKSAKFECYLQMKEHKAEATSSVYDAGVFMQALMRLIKSDEFKPYGETNLKDVSKCFLKLYENQFSSASGNCIVDFDAYDPEKGIYAHSATKTFEHAYDRALYYAVVGAINHYVKTEE